MSPAMDVDTAELRSAEGRIAAQHDPLARQAQHLEDVSAGPGTSGRDYAAEGQRFVSLMRGTLAQSVQESAAEVRSVASTLEATVEQYVATERANGRRLTT